MTAKELVETAMTELFGTRDITAVDRYWSTEYVEHSSVFGSGLDGLQRLVATLPKGFRHERVRVLAENGLVVVHGTYHGRDGGPSVGCDLWRVGGDKIVEHWDAHQPWVETTPSGHSMIDGPIGITAPDQTSLSKQLVGDFVELIMMGGDRSQLPRFFDGDRYIQHNPLIPDGVSGLGQAIQSGVWPATVERCHHVVAEGEFVFTQGEGRLGDRPTAFYDFFRVQDGKLAEHWDVVFTQPVTLPHGHGLF